MLVSGVEAPISVSKVIVEVDTRHVEPPISPKAEAAENGAFQCEKATADPDWLVSEQRIWVLHRSWEWNDLHGQSCKLPILIADADIEVDYRLNKTPVVREFEEINAGQLQYIRFLVELGMKKPPIHET